LDDLMTDSQRARRPTRKERLRDKRPDRYSEILRIATRVFASEGYAATNVNRIADQAGVGVGTLYNYFDDKDDLFLTCVEAAAANDLETKSARVDRAAPALEMLRTVMRVDVELGRIDPDGQQLLRSVFYGINSVLPQRPLGREDRNSGLPVVREAQGFYAGSIELVEQALHKGVAEGVFDFRGESPRLISVLINGMMETFHVLRDLVADEERAPGRPPLVERALEVLCRGILRREP
jgi:AcrR family transcriptional regulator